MSNNLPTIQPKKKPLSHLPREDWQNLVGFMELLLKIDRRNNPNRYKKPKQ